MSFMNYELCEYAEMIKKKRDLHQDMYRKQHTENMIELQAQSKMAERQKQESSNGPVSHRMWLKLKKKHVSDWISELL